MKPRSLLTACILFLAAASPAFSQSDTLALPELIARTNKLTEVRPTEKVYLHFDKPYYATGDTIWFKAYVTSTFNMPSQLSRIMYVDLVSSRDTLMQSLMLQVKNGSASGSFILAPSQFKQDNYHVKAYTKWMANFDQAYFFTKTIPVGSPTNNDVRTVVSLGQTLVNAAPQVKATIVYKDESGAPYANKKITWEITSGYDEVAKGKENTDAKGQVNISFVNAKSVDLSNALLSVTLDQGNKKLYTKVFQLRNVSSPADVQFFPEGGTLLAGFRSRVGVKAIGTNGLGLEFTGKVVDNTGKDVAVASSQHAGMGVFGLFPERGKTYKFIAEFKDGTKGTYELPKTAASGFKLSVNSSDTSRLTINVSADSVFLRENLNKKFYLVGKSGETVCYAAMVTLNTPAFSANVATSKFPTGLAQFTLLTASGLPLSERIVFVMHRDQLNIGISSSKPAYTKRQPVKLTLSGKPGMAGTDLSISVVDETKVPSDENSETTILSSLLLTSDLKGYIESPNYYFKNINEKTAADLDVLLLTQGYRRFAYQDIAANKLPPVYWLPEQGIEISGTLRNGTGMPLNGGLLTLKIPDEGFTARTNSNPSGEFKFSNLRFADSTQVVVTSAGITRNVMLMIDPPKLPALVRNPDYPEEQLNIDTMLSSYLANSKKIIETSRVLQTVELKSKPAAPKMISSHADYPELSSLSNINSTTVSGERVKGCPVLITCLQTVLLGVTYDSQTQNFYVTREYQAGKRAPMAIFVKGMNVDVNYLNGLNAEQIESVEVFPQDDLGLINNRYQTSGVININMKVMPKGQKVSLQELQALLPQPNVVKLMPKGFNTDRVFYSPKYLPGSNPFGPDLRTTIFWNPNISLDAAGKASVDFYTADNKGTYRVVVEGLDRGGHLNRSVYRFKVE